MAGTYKLDVENKIQPRLTGKFSVPGDSGQTMYNSLLAFEKTPGSGFSFTTMQDPSIAARVKSITVQTTEVANDPAKNYYWRLYQGDSEAHQDLNKVFPNPADQFKFVYLEV